MFHNHALPNLITLKRAAVESSTTCNTLRTSMLIAIADLFQVRTEEELIPTVIATVSHALTLTKLEVKDMLMTPTGTLNTEFPKK